MQYTKLSSRFGLSTESGTISIIMGILKSKVIMKVYRMSNLFLLLFIASAFFLHASNIKESLVSQHGIIGDGKTINTVALQTAIDNCSQSGGGTITFPKGTYLTGTINLKSDVHLRILPDATILGSTNLNDYDGRRLIQARGQTNIRIFGGGVIDGQGQSFRTFRMDNLTNFNWQSLPAHKYLGHPKKPTMLAFDSSRDIMVSNIRLQNAGNWTLLFKESTNGIADGVVVNNAMDAPETDGINICSSRDIIVRNCDIQSVGDDGLCVKTLTPTPCYNIFIYNNRINSPANAFKVGTETIGDISNIHFYNNYLECRTDTLWERTTSGITIGVPEGGKISDIVFSNIQLSNVRAPLCFIISTRRVMNHWGLSKEELDKRPPLKIGSISNVVVTGVTAKRCLLTALIKGMAESPIRDISLNDVIFEFEGGMEAADIIEALPEKDVTNKTASIKSMGILPAWGLFTRHIQGLTLNRITFRVLKPDARSGLIFEQSSNIRFSSPLFEQNEKNENSYIQFHDSRDILLEGTAVPPGCKSFILMRSPVAKQNTLRWLPIDEKRIESFVRFETQ